MENIFDTSEKLQITISGNAHSSCHVLLNALKGTATILPEVMLYYSTLSGTKGQILTPNRYDEHPCHFYRRVPPDSDPCMQVAYFNITFSSPLTCEQACDFYQGDDFCLVSLLVPTNNKYYFNLSYIRMVVIW